MTNRSLRALSVLAIVLLLSACGGGDDVEPAAQPPAQPPSGGSQTDTKTLDACTLLDKQDVEAVIGEPVSKVEGQGSPDGAGTCSWYGRETDSLQQKGISLIAARDNGKERWTNHKQLVTGPRNLTGFGDEAFTDGQVIAGYKGNAFVVISPLYQGTSLTADQLKPLGQKVFDKLA